MRGAILLLTIFVLVSFAIAYSSTISLGISPSIVEIKGFSQPITLDFTLFNLNCDSDAYFQINSSYRLKISSSFLNKDIFVKCKTFLNNGTKINVTIIEKPPNGIHYLYVTGRPINFTQQQQAMVAIKFQVASKIKVCIPNNGDCNKEWVLQQSSQQQQSQQQRQTQQQQQQQAQQQQQQQQQAQQQVQQQINSTGYEQINITLPQEQKGKIEQYTVENYETVNLEDPKGYFGFFNNTLTIVIISVVVAITAIIIFFRFRPL